MIIKRKVHGRSMARDIIPEGISIEEMLLQLRNKSWNAAKLTKKAKETYNDCKFEYIMSAIAGKSNKDIIIEIKKHMLSLYDEQVGKTFAGLYLILFTLYENKSIDLYYAIKQKLIKEHVKYHPKQIQKIISYALKNGIFLGIITKDMMIKDKCFVLNWGYYQENLMLNEVLQMVKNSTEDPEEQRWYEYYWRNRHVFQYEIRNNKYIIDRNVILHKKIKKDDKIRKVYEVKKASKEYVIFKYLKKILENYFHIAYSNRTVISAELFALMKDINCLTNYTIFRFDIKEFFESVTTIHIWERYIENTQLDEFIKYIVKQFVELIDVCHAGIPISNVFIEIAGKEFDNCLGR